jgi:integrase
MRFSDATLRALPTTQNGQKLYTDPTLPGFGLRVSTKAKTFVLTVGAERQRLTIGRYPIVSLAQARDKARQILAERQLGIVRESSPSFATVREEYIAGRDSKLRAATRRADGYLFKHFIDLSNKKLADIDAKEIETVLSGIDAPSTRRHAFIRIQGLFRYAVRRGYLDRSPMERLDRPDDQEPRERVLTDIELRTVIHTARVCGYPYGTIVELCAILGQRRAQVAALSTKHIDFANATITWPPAQMKTGRRHTIPFGSMTRSILEAVPPNSDGLYFPSRANGPFVGWSYHKARFDAACRVPDFHLHDLRRTLATRWQEFGVEIATTERFLSHSAITGGLVGIYQRSSYLAQMRDAVERWERHLAALP